MQGKIQVDIIIPIYNAPDELIRCLESIRKYTDLQNNRLILIDDNSPDTRIGEILEGQAQNAIVIKNDINKGFAAIAKASKTDILPIGISGCEEYSWKIGGKQLYVNIGKPISYELELEDIMIQWAKQVGELSGYGYAPEDEIMVHKTQEISQ